MFYGEHEMRAVEEYLDPSAPDAQAQWRSILDRKPVVEGRQVDFVPVEALTCLAASLVVNHRRYGGSTSHQAVEPVPTLARLFRRPNSSVLAKMANLDGSRKNGAKHEIEVAARLLGEPGRLAILYRLLLATAREVGIGPAALPDFLFLEHDDSELLLLGQEELPDHDVEHAVQSAAEQWAHNRRDLAEHVTEQLLIAAARVGQHRFATEVLRNHGHRCVFCGLRVTTAGKPASRMLVASHIKPWKLSSDAERLDIRNGLTACPTHDVAFDTGLLTVNGGLRIHVAHDLELAATTDAASHAAFGRPPLASMLLLPTDAPKPHPQFLDWHRTNIYADRAMEET